MKVNSDKTNMLCISDSNTYHASVFIRDASVAEIRPKDSIKVLGFHFGLRPTMHAHVAVLRKRMNQKVWVLRHLKRVGFTEQELSKVYRTIILPTLNYCAVVYLSQLTDEQDQQIERLQAFALLNIFGYGVPYSQMRDRAGVTTLRQRRIDLCDSFAEKCLKSVRFCKWFPGKLAPRRSARGTEIYMKEYARCDRLRNSPLFYMRRRLNGKPGKTYGERNRCYQYT